MGTVLGEVIAPARLELTLLLRDPLEAEWLELVEVHGGWKIQEAPDDIRNSKTVMLSAIQSAPWVFQYAGPEVRSNRKVVLAAVSQLRWLFQYVADDLQT